MENVKVLVENQPEYLDALKYMLETAGFEVVSAANGKQSFSLLTKNSIQGVLLEYDLPDSTGTAVRAEMKGIKPDVPVLLVGHSVPPRVLVHVSSTPGTACRGEVDANDRLQALWVFSSDARGRMALSISPYPTLGLRLPSGRSAFIPIGKREHKPGQRNAAASE